MLHLTRNKSKHLINVQKRPFLSYLLDNLFDAGYRELILIVGYKEELIEEFLKGYGPPVGLKKGEYSIKTVSQYKILGPKEKEYGTACPLKCVKDIVGNNHFVYLNGDNLYSVRDLKLMNDGENYNYVAGIESKNPERYGVLITDNGFLKEIIEKPKKFVGNLINSGLYKFTPEIFEKVFQIGKSPRGEYEITDAVSSLARERKVKVKKIKDYWLDFGSPADIIKISRFLKTIKGIRKLWKKDEDSKEIFSESEGNNKSN